MGDRFRGLAAAAAGACFALAGCGGGGTDPDTGAAQSAATNAAAFTTTPGPAGSSHEQPLQTQAAPSRYAADSGERAAFDALNAERARCGFGLLSQHSALDLASSDSNDYWAQRLAEGFEAAASFRHVEDPGKSGFTGINPIDRVLYRGYMPAVDYLGQYYLSTESVVFAAQPRALPYPASTIAAKLTRSLMTTVYHARDMFTGYADAGVSYASGVVAPNADAAYRVVFEFEVPPGQKLQGRAGLRTYPCQDTQTAVARFVPATESPNPAPDLGDAVIGTPIFVSSPAGTWLDVQSFELWSRASGASVPARLISHAGDPQAILRINEAFVLPLSPLRPGDRYEVRLQARVDGQVQSARFTFDARADAY